MGNLAMLLAGAGIPGAAPYLPYRLNYEIKEGNGYTALYAFRDQQKALIRQDDSTYLFLSYLEPNALVREFASCIANDDRLCIEPLEAPAKMVAMNMSEVVEWLDRYVNASNAQASRGFAGMNPLLPLASPFRPVIAANTILGGAR